MVGSLVTIWSRGGELLQGSFFLLGSGMMIMVVKDRSIIILLGEMSVLVLPGRLC